MKRFVPPSFIRKPIQDDADTSTQPPAKKCKLAPSNLSFASLGQQTPSTTGFKLGSSHGLSSKVRKPLLTLLPQNELVTKAVVAPDTALYFTVTWRKPTTKKHKTWDGDGILVIDNKSLVLQDTSGKSLSQGRLKTAVPCVGDVIVVGSKECEIEASLPPSQYLSGTPFLTQNKPVQSSIAVSGKASGRAQFKNPMNANSTIALAGRPSVPEQPRHSPHTKNALVLDRPPKSTTNIVDVVVDPFICQFLRSHQREGVSFLYNCIMKFKDYAGSGAILADEMGLGKTLQTIALIWTLLKQNCLPNQGPLARKILVVCPVTLTNNWKREFRKWLGQDRIGVFVVDSKANIQNFIHGKVYQVMIIGYEKLRMLYESDDLKMASFDVIICDEGHKLKSAQNKAAQAIRSLKTPKRIILSGTPIQNDLGEFFVMIDFVNPGLLGTYQTFKREFETPIVRARQPEATKKDREKGEVRSAELTRLTEMFILRRTAAVLTNYLPPKTEIVVFCKPTTLQIQLHKQLLNSYNVEESIAERNSAIQLKAITQLRQLCNSPSLVKDTSSTSSAYFGGKSDQASIGESSSRQSTFASAKGSGKLNVLQSFLTLLAQTDEKVVIVSQFTQTLEILQTVLSTLNLTYCRLDGSTLSTKRQAIVDKFNRTPSSQCFAFLLSAKSGGCGLNLIGASRLILFDSDWNPSVDLQAMARVHRDGQKRPVYIYRFLTTGMIDEKIFQRQVTKQGLSDSLMDAKTSGSSFSAEELRDIFQCHEETDCLTHDMLGCSCSHNGQNQLEGELTSNGADGDGASEVDEEDEGTGWMRASQVKPEAIEKKSPPNNMNALRLFDHVSGRIVTDEPSAVQDVLGDAILQETIRELQGKSGSVSYCFIKRVAMALPDPEADLSTNVDADTETIV